MVTRDELLDIVMADAKSVTAREDSDTIDIIDSVRYHITSHVQTYSEIQSADDKLALVDGLLETLGLDC